MASTSKCPYCDGVITSDMETCPNCGASNLNYVEDKPRVIMTPKTIEELQEYCAERGMPLARMRFFVGEDFKEPRAFGIYKEADGKVIVYKNKDTGERAIRYEGYDEAHGVEELYLKLLDECHKRNIWPDTPDGKPPQSYQQEKKKEKSSNIAWVLGIIIFPPCFSGLIDSVQNGRIVPTVGLSLMFAALLFKMVLSAMNAGNVTVMGKKIDKEEKKARRNFITGTIAVLIFIMLIPIGLSYNNYKHPQGYYTDGRNLYYHLGTSYYQYSHPDD